MKDRNRCLIGLCIPPILLCIVDVTLTLVGQPSQYWAGNYAYVNEMSPAFNQLLQIHPAAAITGTVAEIMILVACILLLPNTLATILSVAATIGHTTGAATWLLGRFHFGFQLCNGLILLSAILIAIGIQWSRQTASDREHRFWKWSPFVRWSLVSLLLGVVVYVDLWPQSVGNENVAKNNNVPARGIHATASTDHELEQLGHVPQLTWLCLSGAEITDAGLERLKGFTKLEDLSVFGLPLTGNGLEHLKGLGHLKRLDLENVSIRDANLKHFAELTQLETIVLRGPQVTDAWLEPLKGLSKLQHLHLEGTAITDAGLAHVHALDRLQYLDLTGTLISSDGLKHLKGLSQLPMVVSSQHQDHRRWTRTSQRIDWPRRSVSPHGELHARRREEASAIPAKMCDCGLVAVGVNSATSQIHSPYPAPSFSENLRCLVDNLNRP